MVVVNESFVRRFSADADVMGRRVFFGKRDFTIVGVVSDAMAHDVQERAQDGIYAPILQARPYGIRVMIGRPENHHAVRSVWMRFSRWLVAGLTFQLAADIIETSVAPGWDDIGQLAAIAVIRTFLNYFLERDQRELREVDHEAAARRGAEQEG